MIDPVVKAQLIGIFFVSGFMTGVLFNYWRAANPAKWEQMKYEFWKLFGRK